MVSSFLVISGVTHGTAVLTHTKGNWCLFSNLKKDFIVKMKKVIKAFYQLNVLSTQIPMLKPNLPCHGIGVEAFGSWLSHEVKPSWMGLVPLWGGLRDIPLPSIMWGHCEKIAVCEPGNTSHQTQNLPVLGSWTSQLLEINFYWEVSVVYKSLSL